MTSAVTLIADAAAKATTTAEANFGTSPPFVYVDGIPNFRDIGGYSITDSNSKTPKSTRRGFVFRSALPTRVTSDGLKTLTQKLGVHTIYDLRSNVELRKDLAAANSLLASAQDVTVLHRPVFPETDTSPMALAKRYANYMSDNGTEGFVAAYTEILHNGAGAYKVIFEHVRDHPDQPFVIHCTAGKDRTGVIVALLLLIAGVKDYDAVGDEYALTESAFDPKLREALVGKTLQEMGPRADEAGVRRMFSARKENMVATLAFIEKEYGGAEGYLKTALGFGDADIELIRKNLTSEEKGIF